MGQRLVEVGVEAGIAPGVLKIGVAGADSGEACVLVVEFFQAQPVFTLQNTPGMDPTLERVIVDLWPTTISESSRIWSMFGGSYVPSVIYRLRVVSRPK